MAFDFALARSSAFEYISRTNSLRALDFSQKKERALSKYIEVWNTKAEIFLPDSTVREICLDICLPDDFPLVLPKIHLSQQDREWIKHIPHVDQKGFVCTMDEETVIIDTDQPGRVVKVIFDKAIRIIEDGLAKKNTADFEEEFIAYWNENYNRQDEIITGISMLDRNVRPQSNAIKFLQLTSAYAGYSIVLHDDCTDSIRFKSFLKDRKYSFEELDAFYLGELVGLQPPFDATNKTVLNIVQMHFPELMLQFTKFINKNSYPKFVLFSIPHTLQHMFFGWKILLLNVKRNGYRNGSLCPIDVLSNFQKNDQVQRIYFDQFTQDRLRLRTEGATEKQNGIKITMAGLGSIGSNLLHFLLPFGIENCTLIDPDVLTMENTPRHLLGMDSIRNYKADAVKRFLESNNPLISVTAIHKSIVHVLANDIGTLNECDYIFVAIGKNNIEEYISTNLQQNILRKPVFLFWIEPYLLGAHCLLLQPEHPINFRDLYPNALFKYNVVSESEYKNAERKFIFKEAGCQASYVPYGMKNIMLFLSAVTPELYRLIESRTNKNLHIAWRGNEQTQKDLSIQLSAFGMKMKVNTILVNEL